MNDDRKKLVERYTRPAATLDAEIPEPSDDEGYQAAAPVSANRPPEAMLELRFKRGDVLALSYPLLITAAHNPSHGITLEFTGHRVTIAGRNLRGIYRAITSHRLAYVQELPGSLDGQPDTETVVASIEVQTV
jgi:hypothetical protein